MIHYLKGVVTAAEQGMLVLEASGIGYEINVPDGCEALLSLGTGEIVTVYTAMIVREDDVNLYGFSDKESLAMFRLLMTVSGVGAKAALSILSALPVGQLAQAIVYEDAAALTKANGIGKKTAQRVVLDLRDKVDGYGAFRKRGQKTHQKTERSKGSRRHSADEPRSFQDGGADRARRDQRRRPQYRGIHQKGPGGQIGRDHGKRQKIRIPDPSKRRGTERKVHQAEAF